MFTDTRPIWVAEKPLSTQNGFTMKPIAASPSLNVSTNRMIGAMYGRASISMSAPNIGPSVSRAAGATARARRPASQPSR